MNQQINDAMLAAFLEPVHALGPQKDVNDMLFDYLKKYGDPTMTAPNTINDQWHNLWDNNGVAKGNWNDRALIWLRNLGYTAPDLSQNLLEFWQDGGLDPTGGNLIVNGNMEVGSGDPWIPTGWSNNGITAGRGTQAFHSDNCYYCPSLFLSSAVGEQGYNTNLFTLEADTYYRMRVWFRAVEEESKITFRNGTNTFVTLKSFKQQFWPSGKREYVDSILYHNLPGGGGVSGNVGI